jgi:hypothetical protein
MCGLIGALLSRPTLTNERMAAALTTIVHRGPDNTAYWLSSDRRMALGHVRLSIIGLVNGDQPIVNANCDVHCVVNGEFYGYKAIRTQLAAEDVRLTTDTDSEIALSSLRETRRRIRPSPARRIRHRHRRRTPPLPDRGARPFRHQAAVLHSGEWRRSARIRGQGSVCLGRAPLLGRGWVSRRLPLHPPGEPNRLRWHSRGAAGMPFIRQGRIARHPTLLGHRLSGEGNPC